MILVIRVIPVIEVTGVWCLVWTVIKVIPVTKVMHVIKVTPVNLL